MFHASRPSRGVVSCVALGLPGHPPKGVVPRYPPRGVLRDCSRPVPGSCRGVVSPLSGGFPHTAAPARVPPSRRKGVSSLTLGPIQDGESKGPHLPSRALGPPAQAQRPRAAASTRTVTEPTRPNAAKRRRLSRADAAAATWTEAFKKWGLDYEPDVARELMCIFSACDALLPSFITHYASGVARWCPPASHEGLEQWFVDELRTAAGHARQQRGRAGVGSGISRVLLSSVRGVFSVGYDFHGTQLPDA